MTRLERTIWLVVCVGLALLALHMISAAADHDRYANPATASVR